MADSKPLPTAQEARDNDRRALSARRLPRSTGARNDLMEPPTVPAIFADDPDGLLDATKIQEQIVVEVPSWGDNPTPIDERLWILWTPQNEPDGEYEAAEVSVPSNAQYPLTVSIPRNRYFQGPLLLSYKVRNFLQNDVFSEVISIVVDTIPPYGEGSPEDLIPPAGGDVVTDAFLDQNGGALTLTIPDTYPNASDDDMVFFYWLKDVPSNPDQLPLPSVPPFTLGTSKVVNVDRALLEQVGDGICYAVYVLKDKANNFSRISFWVASTVALGLLPDGLEAPEVPLANDGKIDRLDAHTGVVVEIPEFDNVKNGDLVHVKWGNSDLAVWPTGPTPQFPIRIPVPWEAITGNYDYDAEDPLQAVTVSYQVSRVGLRFPDPALSVAVNVQLRVVGPDKPDPDPVNPTLPQVLVRGASNLDNQLVESDAGQPATASFLLFEGAEEGDEITLYWGGLANLLHIYRVRDTDQPGTTMIEIEVPWNLIEEASNNLQLPVFYRISDAEQVNYQQSPTTGVSVLAVVVQLPAPEFPDVTVVTPEFSVLNCAAIYKDGDGVHGFRVHVPPNQYIKEGMEVMFDWVVVAEADGNGAIEGTDLVETIRVSADQERNGIDWFVKPYAEKILPAYSETEDKIGYTRLRYSTTVGQVPTYSVFVHVMIGLVVGPISCPLP